MSRRSSEELDAAEGLILLSSAPRVFAAGSQQAQNSIRPQRTISAKSDRGLGSYLLNPAGARGSTVFVERPMVPTWNTHGPPPLLAPVPLRPNELTAEQALEAYLIRQQLLAGVAPKNIIPMRGQRVGHIGYQAGLPPLLQISNQGVAVPEIPPARFNGILPPLPNLPSHSNVPVGPFASLVPTNHNSNLDTRERSQVAREPRTAGFQNIYSAPVRTLAELNANPFGYIPPQGAGQPQNKAVGFPGHPYGSSRNYTKASRALEMEANQTRTSGTQSFATGQNGNRYAQSYQQVYPRPSNKAPIPLLPKVPSSNHGSLRSVVATNDSITKTRRQGARKQVSSRESTHHRKFNILSAFFCYPELALALTQCLGVHELINLHAVARSFYIFVKTHLQEIVDRQAIKDIESARIFPEPCYSKLNIKVPVHKLLSGNSINAYTVIPSFRWLLMLSYREEVVSDIMKLMKHAGYGVVVECKRTLKKLWFLMDIPDNERRVWTLGNRNLWMDLDIFLALIFMVQLENLFGEKRGRPRDPAMRRLLMAQPSLTFLRDVLRKATLKSHFETVKAYIRWQYAPQPHEAGMYVFGVPPHEVGTLQYEGYGRKEKIIKLQRPDELILRELEHRKLDLQQMYVDIIRNSQALLYCEDERLASWVDEMLEKIAGTGLNCWDAVELE